MSFFKHADALDMIILAWTLYLLYLMSSGYLNPAASAINTGMMCGAWYLVGKSVQRRGRF